MKKEQKVSGELNGNGLEGGYINHALSESCLDISSDSRDLSNRYKSNRDMLGSSDFVCESSKLTSGSKCNEYNIANVLNYLKLNFFTFSFLGT